MAEPVVGDVARPARLRYLPALDGVRGLSLIGVIVVHFEVFAGNRPGAPGWLRHTGLFTLNLQMFFVLSGALITSLLVSEHQRTGEISLRGFYLRRSRRLGPTLVLVLALAALLAFAWPGAGVLAHHPFIALAAVSVFLGNWLMFWVDGSLGWLGPAWSLGIEEQFYLTWPFLLRLALRRGLTRRRIFRIWAASMVVSLVASELILLKVGAARAYYATPVNLPGILIGCLLGYELTANPAGRLTGLVRSPMVALTGIVGVTLVSYELQTRPVLYQGGYVLYGVFASLLVGHCFTVAGDRTWITRMLSWRPLVVAGQVSYEAYLLHLVVLAVLLRSFPTLHLYPMMALDLVIVGAASCAIYYLIDQPIRRDGWGVFAARGRTAVGRARAAYARRPIAVAGFALAGAAAVVAVGVIVVGQSPVGSTSRGGTPSAAAPGELSAHGAPLQNLTASTRAGAGGVSGGTAEAAGTASGSGSASQPGTRSRGPLSGLAAAPNVSVASLTIPKVTGLRPVLGPLVGGTLVTIRGDGFTRGTKVFFGDYRVPEVRRVNDTTLTLRAPASHLLELSKAVLHAGKPLAVAVTVRTAGGVSKLTSLTEFSYV